MFSLLQIVSLQMFIFYFYLSSVITQLLEQYKFNRIYRNNKYNKTILFKT